MFWWYTEFTDKTQQWMDVEYVRVVDKNSRRSISNEQKRDLFVPLFRSKNNFSYKVVQIWPGQTVTCLYTNRPGHIWTTLYKQLVLRTVFVKLKNSSRALFRVGVVLDLHGPTSHSLEMFIVSTTKFDRNPSVGFEDAAYGQAGWHSTCVHYPLCLRLGFLSRTSSSYPVVSIEHCFSDTVPRSSLGIPRAVVE